jgi:NAD(P)H-flavin reductase
MECRPGDWLGLRGPFGRGFRRAGAGWWGGGMGIAPLRYLVHRLARDRASFRVGAGARTASEMMFLGDFSRVGAEFATDDGTLGGKAS